MAMADHTATTTTTTITDGCSEEKLGSGVQHTSNDHPTTTTTDGCSEEKLSSGVQHMSNDHTTTAVNSCLTEKWSGGVHLVLDCHVEAAWAILSDYLGITKWVPIVSICSCVEGENKKPGCVRYCKVTGTSYAYERLLEIDDAHKYMSYQMEKNQFVFPEGFQGYVAKVKLSEVDEGKKTLVDWTYVVDPVATQTQEQLTEFMIQFYTEIAKHLETAAKKATTPALPTANGPLESHM